MRPLLLALLTVLFGVSSHARAAEATVGEWSPEHQQLKARFVARFHSSWLDGMPGGPYSEWLIYLELWNTNPTLSTALLKLDLDPGTNITYRVTDGSGRQVKPGPPAFRSTFDPGVYNLVLPPDSRLRLPVSRNGAGVSKDQTKLDVGRVLQGTWYFDRGVKGECALSGTLRVPEQLGRYQAMYWRGELHIPPVKLLIPDSMARDGAPGGSLPLLSATNRTSSTAGSGR
jgi:hypothetical protein